MLITPQSITSIWSGASKSQFLAYQSQLTYQIVCRVAPFFARVGDAVCVDQQLLCLLDHCDLAIGFLAKSHVANWETLSCKLYQKAERLHIMYAGSFSSICLEAQTKHN